MTSGPTLAMAAAARGEGFAIGYGGVAQYDYAPLVGRAFVRAAAAPAGAIVANFPGVRASMAELEARALEELVGPLPRTSLGDGVRATIERFRRVAA